ncbi:MAG: M48 family metalloprotease, partial [Fervidobacterium sp.]
VGHELGHHKGKHIQKLIIISIVYELMIFYLTNILYKFFITKNFLGLSQPYTAFVYAFLFINIIMYFLTPFVNYLSRKFEYESDNYSAKLLGTPMPLIKALKRLVKQNLSNPNPLPIYKLWHYTHPAPEERIKNLLQE